MMNEEIFNSIPLTAITGALCKVLDVTPPEFGAVGIPELEKYVSEVTSGKPVEKIVLYNPDAIAEWLVSKYPKRLDNFTKNSELILPMLSMIPPKTPVCFASIYSGATPSEHGIEKYVKIELKIDTFFDALIRAGKKAIIITVKNQSMDILFRGREMDYISCDSDSDVVREAEKIISEDSHDVICIYNQEYDDVMHRSHPRSWWSKRALTHYNDSYARIIKAVEDNYSQYNTLVGALTDHGVHREWYLLGNHGKNIAKDMNILHFYKVIRKKSI